MTAALTPMGRLSKAVAHQEPDRVPVFLLLTMRGAAEVGEPLDRYFSRADAMVEAQVRLQRRFGHDCYYALTYAAAEHEAFGGEVVFADDGPPNAGPPVLRTAADLLRAEVPEVAGQPALERGLAVLRGLVERARGEVPVIGVVIAPLSLPVMLCGFERWLVLLHEAPEAAARLVEVTTRFARAWAAAQVAAGATAVTVFDPLAAADVGSAALFERHALPADRAVIAGLGAPAALHLASGRVGDRLDAYVSTGAAVLGVSAMDDLAALKRRAAGRIALLGNLNGIRLATGTPDEAREAARRAILAAGPGGGFVLADNHGEIPHQVSDETLHAVMDAARRHGTYPLRAGTDG